LTVQANAAQGLLYYESYLQIFVRLWMRDRSVIRTTLTQKRRRCTVMSLVGFEHRIPVSERQYTVHFLDRAATRTTRKVCGFIVVLYRLIVLSVVLAIGAVNVQGAVGHGACSQNGRVSVHPTPLYLVSGVRLQKFPAVISASSDFSCNENSVAVRWSKTCFEYIQEEEM
jgi:hypothetical protein